MKLSSRGLELIKRHEGLRLKAYTCSAGVWTIGYGHTGPDVTPDLLITKEHADRLLAEDVADAEKGVFTRLKTPPTQNQFDAMVSLAFNIGVGAFAKSTVLRLYNAGDTLGASKAFALWNKAGGKENKGLLKRRLAEAELFLEPEEFTGQLGLFTEEPAPPQTGAIEERTPKPVLRSSSGKVQAAGMGMSSLAVAAAAVSQIGDAVPQIKVILDLLNTHLYLVLGLAGIAGICVTGFAIWRQMQHGGRA